MSAGVLLDRDLTEPFFGVMSTWRTCSDLAERGERSQIFLLNFKFILVSSIQFVLNYHLAQLIPINTSGQIAFDLEFLSFVIHTLPS